MAEYIVAALDGLQAGPVLLWGRRRNPAWPAYHPFYTFDYPNTLPDIAMLRHCEVIFYTAGAGIQAGDATGDVYSVNTFFPVQLAEQLRAAGFRGRLVTFGSYFEIGSTAHQQAYNEVAVLQSALPVPNSYCISKRMLSRYMAAQTNGYPSLFHFILPTVYGPGENSRRLVPYLVQQMAAGQPVQLTAGHQVRQYVYAGDVAAFLANMPPNATPGVYNFPGGKPLTVRALATQVSQWMQLKVPLHFDALHRPDASMPYLALDSTKFVSEMQWQPTTSLQQVLCRYKATITT